MFYIRLFINTLFVFIKLNICIISKSRGCYYHIMPIIGIEICINDYISMYYIVLFN